MGGRAGTAQWRDKTQTPFANSGRGSEVREREAEALRTKLEEDRRGWEVQRRVYEDEIARIHGGVAQAQASALAGRNMVGDIDGGLCADPDAIKAVEQENLRLRVAHEMVERTAAENSTVLREKLSEIQDEFDVLRNRLLQVDDERRRERLDYDTTITDLRTKLSQTSLAERQAPQPVVKPERSTEAMDSELGYRTRSSTCARFTNAKRRNAGNVASSIGCHEYGAERPRPDGGSRP